MSGSPLLCVSLLSTTDTPFPRGVMRPTAMGSLAGNVSKVWDSGATPVCIGEFRLFGPDPAAASMMLGSDLSFTPQELNAGAVFTDNGVPGNPANITAQNGAGWARLRLWVNPPAGYSDLADDLTFAKTMKAAGLKLYLDLHYSDFWADPGKQCIPAGWPTTLSGLTAKVQSYTQGVIAAFAAHACVAGL